MTLIMIFEFLIGMTDIYIAGKVGKEIQATYGFVIQIYFVFIIIANALTTGTVSVISRLFSTGDEKELGSAVFSTLLITAAAGVVFGIAGILLTPYIIDLAGIPRQLKPPGIALGQIYAAGLIFHYMLISINGILRSCKKVGLSLITMAVVCACNIGLNYFLVFFTPLGYKGIALSTAVSVLAGCTLNLRYVRLFVPFSAMVFAGRRVREIIRIGWPFGLSQAFWQVHSMALYLILSSLRHNSVEVLAAFSAGLRIESVVFLPAVAFNMAGAVITGNLIGEKRPGDAFRAGIVTMFMGVSIVVVISASMAMAAPWIAGKLSINPVVISEAVRYIYINMAGEPFMAIWIILAGALSGAGDTKSVMFVIVSSTWLVRVPLCYLFIIVLGSGPQAVWWTMVLSQFISAVLILKRYAGRKWLEAG